jgi:hypothetical protein
MLFGSNPPESELLRSTRIYRRCGRDKVRSLHRPLGQYPSLSHVSFLSTTHRTSHRLLLVFALELGGLHCWNLGLCIEQHHTVLQDTTDNPSLVPGVHTIGDELSNTSSMLPFFAPENCMFADAFAEFKPIPAPTVMTSGVMLKPPPKPKSLDPAVSPPTSHVLAGASWKKMRRTYLRTTRRFAN